MTHAQVDRYAEVPDGTTSYYYRTRTALLRGTGDRVAEIDSANLQSVTAQPIDPHHPFVHLARLTMDQASGSGLALNRARHELVLCAARDPDLAESLQRAFGRGRRLCREVIGQLQPEADAALLGTQTNAVMTFLSGVFVRLAGADTQCYDIDTLSATLEALVAAVASVQ